MPDQGAAILMIAWRRKIAVSAGHIHITIHFDNRNRSYKTCEAIGEAFRAKIWQKFSIFTWLTLGREIKLLESSQNMKCTHYVDQDMVKIISE